MRDGGDRAHVEEGVVALAVLLGGEGVGAVAKDGRVLLSAYVQHWLRDIADLVGLAESRVFVSAEERAQRRHREAATQWQTRRVARSHARARVRCPLYVAVDAPNPDSTPSKMDSERAPRSASLKNMQREGAAAASALPAMAGDRHGCLAQRTAWYTTGQERASHGWQETRRS